MRIQNALHQTHAFTLQQFIIECSSGAPQQHSHTAHKPWEKERQWERGREIERDDDDDDDDSYANK